MLCSIKGGLQLSQMCAQESFQRSSLFWPSWHIFVAANIGKNYRLLASNFY